MSKCHGSEVACKNSQVRDNAADDNWSDCEQCDAHGNAQMLPDNHDSVQPVVHCAGELEVHEVDGAQLLWQDQRGVSLEKRAMHIRFQH